MGLLRENHAWQRCPRRGLTLAFRTIELAICPRARAVLHDVFFIAMRLRGAAHD